MATVVLVGTLDTKLEECEWVRTNLEHLGHDVVLVDVGTFSDSPPRVQVRSESVARAGGSTLAALRAAADRGDAMGTMGTGAAKILRELYREGSIHGILGIGGSSGSSVAATAMQALPVGFPKLLVSTMVSGDVTPYVGVKDVTLMPSVVDVAGINRVSRGVLRNAVAAIGGMASSYATQRSVVAEEASADAPVVAATMFGVTTPAVDEARARLLELGYEVLVFHATGAGGRAMEALVTDGLIDGVLDLTTTELVDDLLGGVLSAGPDRLEATGRAGVPQIVSLGALDMCNFGPFDTVPEKYGQRSFVLHNPTITLMRTTAEENTELGRRIGTKLASAKAPVEVHVPLRGFSALDVAGQKFDDPVADAACITALKTALGGTDVVVIERESAINDPGFGRAAADALHRLIQSS